MEIKLNSSYRTGLRWPTTGTSAILITVINLCIP